MDTQLDVDAQPRVPLSRERVLRAAVALADEHGVEAISMRRIAGELGVVPMALYKHVSSKDELLDGMIDVVVGEIDPPAGGTDGKAAIRRRVLGPPGAPAPPLGVLGHRVADRSDPGGHRVHGLDDRDVPGLGLLGRPDPSRHARHGQPPAGVQPGAVRRHRRGRPRDAGRGAPGAGRPLPQHHRAGHGDHPRPARRSARAATTSSSSSSRWT